MKVGAKIKQLEMSNLVGNNDEFVFQGGQRKNLYDMLKLFKGRVISKSERLITRRNKINNVTSLTKYDEISPCKNRSISNDKYPNQSVFRFSKRLQLCPIKNEIEDIEMDLKHGPKNTKQNRIQSFKLKKSEKIFNINEKKLTSNGLLQRIESARSMGEERINRANAYYNKLLSFVESHAINEAAEFILNDLSRKEISLLIDCDLNHTFFNDSQEISLLEVYLQARSKLSNIINTHQNGSIPEENLSKNNSGVDKPEKDLDHDFVDAFSNLKLQGDKDLNEFLSSIGTNNLFIESSIEYLVSRTCDVSLEINRTLIGCIQKDIIDINTGIYKGIKK